MKAKISRGNGFRGVLNYITREEKVAFIGGKITREMWNQEREMIASAKSLNADKTHQLSAAEIDAAIAEKERLSGFFMSDEQRAAVHHICQSSLDIVQGSAGSGKTFSVEAVKLAYESRGYQIYGACTSKRAAQNLQDDSGIKSYTIAKLLKDINDGTIKPDGRSVFVIDEAGMVSTGDMAQLVEITKAANAKLILTGEDKQIDAVERPGALRYLSRGDQIGCARIETIIRQSLDHSDPDPEWRRKVVMNLRDGLATDAITALDQRGLINIEADADAAKAKLVDDWNEYRKAKPDKDSILLAQKWTDIEAMSSMVRDIYKSEGTLGDEDIELACVVGSGRHIDFSFSRGERIKFGKNDSKLNVINGTIGTIEHISQCKDGSADFVVKTDDGKNIRFNSNEYADKDGRFQAGHAYVQTFFSSQGLTVDGDAFVYTDSSANRSNAYVPGSRAKDNTHFYCDGEGLSRAAMSRAADDEEITRQHQLDQLAFQMSRDPRPSLATEWQQTKGLSDAEMTAIYDEYDRNPKSAHIIGGNMSGTNARELAAEFGTVRATYENARKPVWHTALALPKDDRHVSDEEWQKIAESFLDKMGIDTANHQYVTVRHSDTEFDHIHIVLNRIGMDQKMWLPGWDVRNAIQATRELEKEFDLAITPGLESSMRPKTNNAEMSMFERLKAEHPEQSKVWVLPRAHIRTAVNYAIKDSNGTYESFVEQLAKHHVAPRLNEQSTGNVAGISYEITNHHIVPPGMQSAFKGSHVSKASSWKHVNERLEQQLEQKQEIQNEQARQSRRAEQDHLSRESGAGTERAAADAHSSDRTHARTESAPRADQQHAAAISDTKPGSQQEARGLSGEQAIGENIGSDGPSGRCDIESDRHQQDGKHSIERIERSDTQSDGSVQSRTADQRKDGSRDQLQLSESGTRSRESDGKIVWKDLLVERAGSDSVWRYSSARGRLSTLGLLRAGDETGYLDASKYRIQPHPQHRNASANTVDIQKMALDAESINPQQAATCKHLAAINLPELVLTSMCDQYKSVSATVPTDALALYPERFAHVNATSHRILAQTKTDDPVIVVSGLDAESVSLMYKDGLTPAAVIEAAPGEHEAWIRLSKADSIEPKVKERAAAAIIEEYGGELREEGGHLAGFAVIRSDLKVAIGNHSTCYPIAQVNDTNSKIGEMTRELVRQARETVKEEQREASKLEAKKQREIEDRQRRSRDHGRELSM